MQVALFAEANKDTSVLTARMLLFQWDSGSESGAVDWVKSQFQRRFKDI